MPSKVSPQTFLEIHDELVRIWNQPPAGRPAPDWHFTYYRNAEVEPSMVLVALRRIFPSGAIRPALVIALEKSLEVLGQGHRLDERQRFLTACCVELLDADADVAADPGLVRRLIRHLDPLCWHRALRHLVANHLTALELMDTLRLGMVSVPSTATRIPALEGVRLYRGFVKRAPVARRSRRWFGATRARVQRLERHPCAEIRRDAEFTGKWLRQLAAPE